MKDIIIKDKPDKVKTRHQEIFNKSIYITLTGLGIAKLENWIQTRIIVSGPEIVRASPSDMLAVRILKTLKRGDSSMVVTAPDLAPEV